MRSRYLQLGVLAVAVKLAGAARAQTPSAATAGPLRITLADAIQMALTHSHTLKAARTTIQQDEALEITANRRPNPVLTADAQFLPIFQPNKFMAGYIKTPAQFDLGLAYLFERGRKRTLGLQAARDVTADQGSIVADAARSLACA